MIAGRDIVEDRRLRLIDRGLLLTLLSLPETWDFSVSGMSSILPDGKSAINSSMDRLIKAGYVKRSQSRENGKFGDICLEVFDSPFIDFRQTENPSTEKPLTENHTQLNNKLIDTKRLNTNGCYDKPRKDIKNGNKQRKCKDTSSQWSDAERTLYGL